MVLVVQSDCHAYGNLHGLEAANTCECTRRRPRGAPLGPHFRKRDGESGGVTCGRAGSLTGADRMGGRDGLAIQRRLMEAN